MTWVQMGPAIHGTSRNQTSQLMNITEAPGKSAETSAIAPPSNPDLYLYWLEKADLLQARDVLAAGGIGMRPALLTPCQVMRATKTTAIYATPAVWSRMCVRQGSWYRASRRAGLYMLMSTSRLPEAFDEFLDAELSESSFVPEELPSRFQLQQLVDSPEYRDNKPVEWEKKTTLDAIMFKLFFTVTRIWKRTDTLKKHWLGHRANHANFLAHHFTTDIEGEKVPYSVTENAGICSSCVEYFNVIDDSTRKLVRACPGAVTFGGAKRDTYLDVKPVR